MLQKLIKQSFNMLDPDVQYGLRRWWCYRKGYKTGWFASNGIDKRVASYLRHSDGFYVDVGANDGVFSSNTMHFELLKNWRGVLVEPAPSLFSELLRRRSHTKNYVECAACVSEANSGSLLPMNYAGAMSVLTMTELSNLEVESHVRAGTKFLHRSDKPYPFGAVSKTLTSILDVAHAPRTIDFLSIDVEGPEMEVLLGIDFNKYTFSLAVIESRSIDQIKDILSPHGYTLIEALSPHDYLFRHKSSVIDA